MPFGRPMDIIQGVVVPCGKCIVCKRNKAAEWALRLKHELEYNPTACFLTLTYNDENIPYQYVTFEGKEKIKTVHETVLPTLNKYDVQLFMKRLRKEIGVKIKYFMCGEYGKKTERPHYHCILFGWKPKKLSLLSRQTDRDLYTSDELNVIWGKGVVQVGSAEENSIYYTTGYVIKKMHKTNLDGRLPEYIQASQALGLKYAEDHKEIIYSGRLLKDGNKTAIPKYYIKKIGIDKREQSKRIIDNEVKVKLRLKTDDREKVLSAIYKSRRQGEIELETKKKIAERLKKDTEIS